MIALIKSVTETRLSMCCRMYISRANKMAGACEALPAPPEMIRC